MRVWILTAFVACAAIASGGTAAATLSAAPLSFRDLVALARTDAFEVRFAQARVVESRGRLVQAGGLSQSNPTLEVTAGKRHGDVDADESEIAITMPFGFGANRGPRVATAKADLRREESSLDDARRVAIGRAANAFYRAQHASRLVEIAAERCALADSLVRIARERERAGDVAMFDVTVAEAEESRAASDLAAQQGNVIRARGEVAYAIGFASTAELEIGGDLADRSYLDSLLASGANAARSDVDAARAYVEQREAEVTLSGRARIPDISLLASSAREDGEKITRGGAEITLPIFQRGAGSRGEARGRLQLAQSESDAVRSAAAIETETAIAVHEAAMTALREFEERALPSAATYSAMVTQSYRAGRIDLPSLLLIRREALETRIEHAGRLLEAANAAIDLALAKGILR
ncbi:MAG: TolC family protein [bacterium]